jgi:cystathionine beta-lyase
VQVFPLGSTSFEVEHRAPGEDGGPTLRVRDAAGHERLRFDCFARGAHWHADPDGRDEITRLGPAVDALEWTLAELRRDLAGWLARGGLRLEPAHAAAAGAVLDRVELALRNPPVDLDDLDVALLRRSRGEKWQVYAEDVLPVWVADMDFPLAEPVRRVLRHAWELSDVRYPLHPRPTDLPEIFAERMRRCFGWRVDPGRVELITDVVQGMAIAVDRFTAEGDGVVAQTPVYPPFLGTVAQLRRRLVENPLVEGPHGFEVDLDGLRRVVDAGTRAILLCHPHNPTGRVLSRAELEGVAALALERDLVVVSDELHGDLVLPGAEHVPFASLGPEVEARTITLTAASKAFNIAGLRCAVAVFGSDALRRRFLELPRYLRGGLGILGIEATRAAWRFADPWREAVLAKLAENRRLVAERVAKDLPGVRFHPPEATYFAWLDCRGLGLEPSPYRFFLDRARVAFSDGASFGRPGNGFVRLNFATSRAIVTEAIERAAKALKEIDR